MASVPASRAAAAGGAGVGVGVARRTGARLLQRPSRRGRPADRSGKRMKLEELTVTGMSCASCSARVERVVGTLEGVTLASVNLATEKLRLEYDEARVSVDAVKDAVRRAGYGVALPVTTRHVVMPIGGMTCAACSARIEKVVGKLAGVASVSVNLATERADIDRKSVV